MKVLNCEGTMGKGLVKIDYILCGFLALAFTASPQYIKNGNCSIDGVYVLSAITFFIVLLGVNIVVRKSISLYYQNRLDNQSDISLFCDRFFASRKSLLKTALVILICWLPVLIALYPGTFINDTWGQLQQFMVFTDGGQLHRKVLSNHHPFFDTLLMGGFIIPWVKLTDAWHAVIFVYVLIQSFITSLTFAYSVIYVYKKLKIGRAASIGILAFYCIMPMYATSVQTVSKDALFSWIYVLFFVFFMEIVRTNGDVLKDKPFFVKFLLTVVFCIVTKKVGFYIIGASILILYKSNLVNKRKIGISLVVAFCMMSIVLPLTKYALGVHSGGIQEMFSIPFQQTARYIKYHPNDITPDEKVVIDKVLNFTDLAERYDPLSADPVKGYSQRGHTKDYLIYLKTWIAQGVRHPGTYIDGFNAMVSGWFSFYEYKPLMDMEWHSQLDPKKIPEWVPERNDFFKWTSSTYEKAYDIAYHNPFITVFLCYGFYASLIPAFMLATVFRSHRRVSIKYWLVAVPMVLSIGLGCWLAPVSIHFEGRRYLYPIIYTTPLIIAWCLFFYKNEEDETKQCLDMQHKEADDVVRRK